jgi:hypothetical protein
MKCVMPGLVPGIHELFGPSCSAVFDGSSWMTATSAVMTKRVETGLVPSIAVVTEDVRPPRRYRLFGSGSLAISLVALASIWAASGSFL